MEAAKAWEYLRHLVLTEQLPQTAAFVGPTGAGKQRLAWRVATAMLCSQRGASGDACGTCTACELCARQVHPQVSSWQGSETISIEQVRELMQRAQRVAVDRQPYLWIVGDAQRCSLEAANALLKHLEEPRQLWHTMLLVEDLSLLLPTLRSRCQVLALSPPPPAERAKQYVAEGRDPEEARLRSLLSTAGAKAVADWTSESFAQRFQRVVQWVQKVVAGSPASLQAAVVVWEGSREEAMACLDLAALWLVERCREGESHKILEIMEGVLLARQRLIQTAIQPQAVVEKLVLEMLAVARGDS